MEGQCTKKKKWERGEEKITKKFALVHTLEKKIKLKNNNHEGISCLSFEVFVNGHELVFALLIPIFFM